MPTLGEIIKAYRTEQDMSMDDFSKASGISKAYISVLEKNKRPGSDKPVQPSVKCVLQAAKAMGVDGINLMFAISNDELKNDTDSLQYVAEEDRDIVDLALKNNMPKHDSNTKSNRIKVYGSVPAGIPIEAVEDIVDWEDVPQEWIDRGDRYIGLKVKGDSMYPKYIEDDTVIVKLQPDCECGQDAVVYVNGYEATLKKVVKQQDGIMLQPLNPEYTPKFYPYGPEEPEINVLGIVVEIRRKV
nr:MAG TPA: SOS-response transcriptional repressors (RecA-mediated autopeptidases) [Caudoviricetes sp.]